ncbi:glutathione S-transferase [Leptospira ryugenii]|uniref:Glutathione S-transferase n=1 Tax=Leptospira ryugenii TaxID=1917863 RepID=A0A2P2E1M1_9LEPT|nr:glutathione S-transferase family protein [Leptospira ryugenii]GBF50764.1 glutathione S-transferase [Leptospira ryugenii]
MLELWGDHLSGNCYKVEMLFHFLDIPYKFIAVDTKKKETQSLSFLAHNPNGKIPLVLLENGNSLWESNAILHYFAEGTSFLPTDSFEKAKVLQWQFFEQYSHEPYIAVARYIQFYLGLPENRKEEYESKKTGGRKALAVMESHLSKYAYFVGKQMSIADISLYAYTHVAEEGGFSLAEYPAIQAWIKRIETTPGYTKMQRN